ncbi:MAG: universal stress protein [Bdellovibrio sp.]|nr:universal stress protein [Bdellovibrio sp.]
MTCLVAIESDPKSAKIIEECWKDLAKDSNAKVLVYDSLATLAAEFAKPESSADKIVILMVPVEILGADPEKALVDLATLYNCDMLVSLFDDPAKSIRKLQSSITKNLIYKPIDPTIFKEHTRFVLFPAKKVKTQYVHTTVSKNKLESLKKFNFTQLSEAGFKIGKQYPLEMGKAYKFYHHFFQHQKNQHVWGRVVNEDDTSYEVIFAQISAAALNSVRKKIASVKVRFKNPSWRGLTSNTQTGIDIVIHIDDETIAMTIQQLIERTYSANLIMHKKDFKTADKIQADLLITDLAYEEAMLKNEFIELPKVIRLYQENLNRDEIEERLTLEYIRTEKPLDKAHLNKALKSIYPLIKEKETSQLTTISNEGVISLSEQMIVEEFSEAAMGFNHSNQFKVNEMIDIALTQEDETDLKEMKVKIHYVDEKPSEKVYFHQGILYGMKDEFLKQMRLWTLQMHIEKNKNK